MNTATWFLLVLGVPVAIGMIVIYISAEKRRRRVFRQRPIISLGEWFELYSPDAKGRKKEIISVILASLSANIGVYPTQLWPTDRFDKEFALRNVPLDDGLDPFSISMEKICMQFLGRRLKSSPSWQTLDDLICDISAQLDAVPGKE
jgi:hypothetical protein